MSTNKHAQIRYQALDRCFAKRGTRYFWQDLAEACREALYEFTGHPTTVSRRQIMYDITYMQSEQGWSAPIEGYPEGKRKWYSYTEPDFSINKRPLSEAEAGQIKEALLTLSRFKGMPQFQWVDELVTRLESGFGLRKGAERIIEFEENPYLKGAEHITELFQAILGEQVLELRYQGFKQKEPVTLHFHPYYLKQYNNRWFAFGHADGQSKLTNVALDRIRHLAPAKGKFVRNATIDFAEYFEDVVGVTIPDEPAVGVDIRVTNKLWPYLESKPLHGSQRVLARTNEDVRLRLEVRPNHELQALLLSYGDGLEVLSPPLLRKALRAHAEAMAQNYGE